MKQCAVKKCSDCKEEFPCSEAVEFTGPRRTIYVCRECGSLRALNLKRCTECKQVFPRTEEYFYPYLGSGGYSYFQSCCKKCNSKRSDRFRLRKKSAVKLPDVKRSYYKEADMEIHGQVFSIESLEGNRGRCVRCNNIPEERDMKYEPDLGGEILGSYIYYHCWMCGQDYYEHKEMCEVGK